MKINGWYHMNNKQFANQTDIKNIEDALDDDLVEAINIWIQECSKRDDLESPPEMLESIGE